MSRLHELCAEGPGRPRILVLKLDPPEEFLREAATLAQLRNSFPQGDLTLLCQSANVAAAENLGVANQVRIFDPAPARDMDTRERQREQLRQFGHFDIAIDLRSNDDTRPLLQHVHASLRCGLGSRHRFPFLDIALSDSNRLASAPPIDANEIVFEPNAFRSRMPLQTRFFHETDFSVRDAHLIYGPYARLPVGRLRVSFAFELSAPRRRTAGRLNLAVEIVRNRTGDVVAFRRIQQLPNGQLSAISLEFTNEDAGNRYEFRVFVGGKPWRTRLRFFGVLVERVTSDLPMTEAKADSGMAGRLSSLVSLVAERSRQLKASLPERSTSDAPIKGSGHWPLPFYPLLRPVMEPVPPPKKMVGRVQFTVVLVDSSGAPASAEATLKSLSLQTHPPHEVVVLGPHEYDSFALAGQITANDFADQSVCAAIDHAAGRAIGTHVIVLEAGSELDPNALAWFSAAIEDTQASILYSDAEAASEEPDGAGPQPLFQPAFDYERLLQRNYIGGTFCIKREAYLSLGGLTDDSRIDPWHDLLLRAVESLGRGAFVHLPLVLLATPVHPDSTAAQARAVGTVQHHLDRIGSGAQAAAHHDIRGRSVTGAVSVRWPDDPAQRISVIVPTRGSVDLVFALVSSLRRHALNWDRVHVTVTVNGEASDRTRLGFSEVENQFENVRVQYRPCPFNWSAINNRAAADDVTGTILLFLNDDMICLTPAWDARLVGQLSRQEIGVVGARLLYPDGTLQHAGLAIGEDASTAHEAAREPAGNGLYRDRTLLVHGAAVVTGAFLGCRRSVFEGLGGFDAERYAVTSADADFCLRVQAIGRDVIYDPGLTWVHYESVSRGYDQDDHRKQKRSEAEHALWKSRFTELDLIDLNGNPHLERGLPPYDAFHFPGPNRIALWLQAQTRRASRWAKLGPTTPAVQANTKRGPVRVAAIEP